MNKKDLGFGLTIFIVVGVIILLAFVDRIFLKDKIIDFIREFGFKEFVIFLLGLFIGRLLR
jgi:hypothetical protein